MQIEPRVIAESNLHLSRTPKSTGNVLLFCQNGIILLSKEFVWNLRCFQSNSLMLNIRKYGLRHYWTYFDSSSTFFHFYFDSRIEGDLIRFGIVSRYSRLKTYLTPEFPVLFDHTVNGYFLLWILCENLMAAAKQSTQVEEHLVALPNFTSSSQLSTQSTFRCWPPDPVSYTFFYTIIYFFSE